MNWKIALYGLALFGMIIATILVASITDTVSYVEKNNTIFLTNNSLEEQNVQLQKTINEQNIQIRDLNTTINLLNESNEELRTTINYYRNEIDQLSWYYHIEEERFNYDSDIQYSIITTDLKEATIIFNKPIWLIGEQATQPEWKMSCQTESMKPLFDCHDTLIAYKPDADDIQPGDIVTFKAPENEIYNPYKYNWLIHKITWREGDWIGTMGINNQYEDYPTHISNVTGKIWR